MDPKKLMSLAQQLTSRFLMNVINAPSSYTKVFGQKVPTKWDVEKSYCDNLKYICMVARQINAPEVIKYCQAQVDADQDSLDAIKKEIKEF